MTTSPWVYVVIGASATTPEHDRTYSYPDGAGGYETDTCTCDGLQEIPVGYTEDGYPERHEYDDGGIEWFVHLDVCRPTVNQPDLPVEDVLWVGFTCRACGADFGVPWISSVDGYLPFTEWETM